MVLWTDSPSKIFTGYQLASIYDLNDCPPEKAARIITHFSLPIAGAASMKQAQICSGGILLQELTEGLACRRQEGLFACGEALNVAGPCGGYNLQWAWTSGWIAGEAAAGETLEKNY